MEEKPKKVKAKKPAEDKKKKKKKKKKKALQQSTGKANSAERWAHNHRALSRAGCMPFDGKLPGDMKA